jgi:hypothetical protein
MTKSSVALNEYLINIGLDEDINFLRESVQLLTQMVIELEAEEQIGADKHERTPNRSNHRNGYRLRSWETRVGDTATQDFFLGTGQLIADPESLYATLNLGAMQTMPLTLTNTGLGDVNFEIFEVDDVFVPTSLGHEDMNYPRSSGAPSSGAVPGAKQASSVKVDEMIETLLGAPANAMELVTNYLIYFEAETPGSWTSLFYEPGSFFAGDFISGDFNTLYVIAYIVQDNCYLNPVLL